MLVGRRPSDSGSDQKKAERYWLSGRGCKLMVKEMSSVIRSDEQYRKCREQIEDITSLSGMQLTCEMILKTRYKSVKSFGNTVIRLVKIRASRIARKIYFYVWSLCIISYASSYWTYLLRNSQNLGWILGYSYISQTSLADIKITFRMAASRTKKWLAWLLCVYLFPRDNAGPHLTAHRRGPLPSWHSLSQFAVGQPNSSTLVG